MYKLNEKEETLIKKFESVPFGIDDSILRTIFFKKSWLGIKDLEYNNFLLKLEQLKEMDTIRDPKSKDIIISHILFIDYRSKLDNIFVIPLEDFLDSLKHNQKELLGIFNVSDFYIPRSLWWKLSKELYLSKN